MKAKNALLINHTKNKEVFKTFEVGQVTLRVVLCRKKCHGKYFKSEVTQICKMIK